MVGIGNAIVDVITQTDDDFIGENDLEKGAMTLIDAERATSLYAVMPAGIEASGGSAANTAVGITSFGSTAAYVGKVRNDQLGEVFRHDIRASEVGYDVPLATDGPPTARCLIMVTPDAERTMNTFLGISSLLEPSDVDESLTASAKVVYCEGYLWDVDSAKEAMLKGMRATERGGGKVALTLSDSFCVDRHRPEFLDLVANHVDILFANEAEIRALYEVEEFEDALALVREDCAVACLTRGAAGSEIVTPDGRISIPAWRAGEVVDTTGAGDLYAAGFLHGFCSGADLERSGRLGSLAAGEVISHVGPRPAESLAELAMREGFGG